MRQTLNRRALVVALGMMLLAGTAKADALITDFDNFTSNLLFGSWSTADVVSGPTSYDITATGGYGSNWKYIGDQGIVGAGHTTIELTVTLEGPPEADGQLGVLFNIIDGDGSHYFYRWYGQTLGTHTLTMPVQSPTVANNPGSPPAPVPSIPGLDLNSLQHLHLELDPGAFSGTYTVKWENLVLTNYVPEPSSLVLLGSCGALIGLRRRK